MRRKDDVGRIVYPKAREFDEAMKMRVDQYVAEAEEAKEFVERVEEYERGETIGYFYPDEGKEATFALESESVRDMRDEELRNLLIGKKIVVPGKYLWQFNDDESDPAAGIEEGIGANHDLYVAAVSELSKRGLDIHTFMQMGQKVQEDEKEK